VRGRLRLFVQVSSGKGGLELFYAGEGAGGGRPISYYLRRCCLPTGTP
jgi:hypothetical protein